MLSDKELEDLASRAGFGVDSGVIYVEHKEGICTKALREFARLLIERTAGVTVLDGETVSRAPTDGSGG